jgi:hypothetical protein
MARRHIDKSGWNKEAEAEDIDGFATHSVNVEGPHAYRRAYDQAKNRLGQGEKHDDIRRGIIREPERPKPLADGTYSLNLEKSYEAERRLSEIRKRAVEDALSDRPANYTA